MTHTVPHVGQNNPATVHARADWLGSNSAKKGLGIPVGNKPNIRQQCVPVARKVNHTLACISKSVASKSREVVIPLYLALARPHME